LKAKRKTPNKRRPIRVVLAEDYALPRDLIIKLLSGKPNRFHLVAAVATLLGAIGACIDLKPNLLLLSMSLMGREAGTSMSEIRRQVPDVNILAYAGPRVNEADAMQIIQEGVTGYVGKAVDASEFLEAINRTSRGENYFCAESSHLLSEIARGRAAASKEGALSSREIQILRFIANGRTNKEIARTLGLSVATIDTHRRNLMVKARAHNTADLIRYGLGHHLLG
jgi:two-component system nitrate/nitrite response regulator NarL